jgi:Domain of unknown function (DUF4431)
MRIGILKTLVALGATFFVSSVVSARECLDYEPAMITIQGSVSLKPAYGPPGFGEDPKHDAREDYLALTLDAPVCMKASSEPHTDDVSETEIKAMQLVFRNGEAFKQTEQWIEKRISVTGSLFHGFTGHHHTTVLLKVKEIGQAVNSR